MSDSESELLSPQGQVSFGVAWEDLLLQLLAGTCALLLCIVVVDVRHQRQPQLNGIRASTVRGEIG